MIKITKRNPIWIRKNHKKFIGIHLIAEFWKVKKINDVKTINKVLNEAAKKSKNIPIKTIIYKFSSPPPYDGITAITLLKESHIAIHAWPEFDYLAIDIFTCGDKAMPEKAIEYLKEIFKPQKVEIKKIIRGALKIKE